MTSCSTVKVITTTIQERIKAYDISVKFTVQPLSICGGLEPSNYTVQ